MSRNIIKVGIIIISISIVVGLLIVFKVLYKNNRDLASQPTNGIESQRIISTKDNDESINDTNKTNNSSFIDSVITRIREYNNKAESDNANERTKEAVIKSPISKTKEVIKTPSDNEFSN